MWRPVRARLHLLRRDYQAGAAGEFVLAAGARPVARPRWEARRATGRALWAGAPGSPMSPGPGPGHYAWAAVHRRRALSAERISRGTASCTLRGHREGPRWAPGLLR